MKLMTIFSSACLLMLTSCHPENGQNPASASTSQNKNTLQLNSGSTAENITLQRVTEFNSNFSNFEEFKENLNKYIVHADFTGHEGEFTLSCETQSSPHDKKQFQKQFGVSTQTTDLTVDLNDIVAQKETLHCSVDSDSVTKKEIDFEIKRDLLLTNSVDVSKNMVAGKNYFGALVLDEDVVLETLGTNLDLRVDQLISSNATLTTFAQEKNLRAANDQDGQSGGMLTINAASAYGQLKIKMRGQDGGVVTKSPKKREERPIIDESFNGQPMITEYQESCDDRGDRQICGGWRSATQCPTDGKKGLKGFKGLKAYDGRNGGNSGIANVTVADGTLFDLEITLTKGLGSLAGHLGEGGPGSEGGAPGSYDGAYIGDCSNKIPSRGAIGDTGDLGDPGASGKDGSRERATYFDLKNSLKVEY
ncbi:MAG: hypothetical protein ACXVLQ_15970 [Bacteriovorax sp.]